MKEQNPQSNQSTIALLESKVQRIGQAIAAQQDRLSRGSQRTAVVGGIICLLIAGWFTYGYYMLGQFLKPKQLVAQLETMLLGRLGKERQNLEEVVRENATEWAAMLSNGAQSRMPQVREELENFIMGRADEQLAELTAMSTAQLRTFVGQNRQMMADGFGSLKDPNKAKRFVDDLGKAVEVSLAIDMGEQADELLQTLILLNHKLAVLHKGEHLNAEQALEREALMIAKRLQVDSATASDTPEPRKKFATRPTPASPQTTTPDETAEQSSGEGEKPAKDESKGDDLEKNSAKEPEKPGSE